MDRTRIFRDQGDNPCRELENVCKILNEYFSSVFTKINVDDFSWAGEILVY